VRVAAQAARAGMQELIRREVALHGSAGNPTPAKG
jgi:hypothetical protein